MARQSRRNFFRIGSTAVSGVILGGRHAGLEALSGDGVDGANDPGAGWRIAGGADKYDADPSRKLDLSPAKWIWFPGQRTLANSVFFFRKQLQLREKPVRAEGWIIGDSRYKLYVNGVRIQFGPAPYDPRWAEADPVDLSDVLVAGANTIGAEVLFYGVGDGTMPIGKPGFILLVTLVYPDGSTAQVVSDASWQTAIARSWRPGGYKRWYLRSFQECFDARLYPYGWNNTKGGTAGREMSSAVSGRGEGTSAIVTWLAAVTLDLAADKPSLCGPHADYLFDTQVDPRVGEIRRRSISMPKEAAVAVTSLAENYWLSWKVPPEDYFDLTLPDASEKGGGLAVQAVNGQWSFTVPEGGTDSVASSAVLTFVLAEQIVGFPFFMITAAEGTVIELLVHEAHAVGASPLINTHFNAWSRFICREGTNTFETFDFESVKYIQLHVRRTRGQVVVGNVGVRRRTYGWRHAPDLYVSDPLVSKVLVACINTLYNSAIETCVDGMGRERQQYSGDGGHQLHAVQFLGEPAMHARFCNTFSQGCTLEGYFMDSWPAYDRLARLFERQLDLSRWGPLLDHSIGFFFDCYYYYQYTGEVAGIRETFPRLVKCLGYLLSLRGVDGMLPVEDVGVHWIWMDSDSYPQQAYKKCAFNLYMIAMLRHAFVPLAEAFGEKELAALAHKEATDLLAQVHRAFWSPSLGTFVDNPTEPVPHFSERALSLALLYDLCPDDNQSGSLKIMTQLPPTLGRSYPANTAWNYWAYAKLGRGDLILKEMRERWYPLQAVQLNNTTPEGWNVTQDSNNQWSHCAVSPLFCFYMNIVGIQPLVAGWKEIAIRPQLADLEEVHVTIPTAAGDVFFHAKGRPGQRKLMLRLPMDTVGWLLIDEKESVPLGGRVDVAPGLAKYRVEGGQLISVVLKH